MRLVGGPSVPWLWPSMDRSHRNLRWRLCVRRPIAALARSSRMTALPGALSAGSPSVLSQRVVARPRR
eukprot:9427719-Lingulodinium_polyedra.AAC.1